MPGRSSRRPVLAAVAVAAAMLTTSVVPAPARGASAPPTAAVPRVSSPSLQTSRLRLPAADALRTPRVVAAVTDEQGAGGWYRIAVRCPMLSHTAGSPVPAVWETVSAALRAACQAQVTAFRRTLTRMRAAGAARLSLAFTVFRADERVVSLELYRVVSPAALVAGPGGPTEGVAPSGEPVIDAFTFDLGTGKRLGVGDVLLPGPKLVTALAAATGAPARPVPTRVARFTLHADRLSFVLAPGPAVARELGYDRVAPVVVPGGVLDRLVPG